MVHVCATYICVCFPFHFAFIAVARAYNLNNSHMKIVRDNVRLGRFIFSIEHFPFSLKWGSTYWINDLLLFLHSLLGSTFTRIRMEFVGTAHVYRWSFNRYCRVKLNTFQYNVIHFSHIRSTESKFRISVTFPMAEECEILAETTLDHCLTLYSSGFFFLRRKMEFSNVSRARQV